MKTVQLVYTMSNDPTTGGREGGRENLDANVATIYKFEHRHAKPIMGITVTVLDLDTTFIDRHQVSSSTYY